jgi:hypothetical protein
MVSFGGNSGATTIYLPWEDTMVSRAIALVGVLALILGLGLFTGCGCGPFGAAPPRFKVCNGARLIHEFQWLYADIQDLIFGVDYYADMNSEFGPGPY